MHDDGFSDADPSRLPLSSAHCLSVSTGCGGAKRGLWYSVSGEMSAPSPPSPPPPSTVSGPEDKDQKANGSVLHCMQQ